MNLKPRDVPIDGADSLSSFQQCELGGCCLSCQGLNAAMAILVLCCKKHDEWCPVGRVEIAGVVSRALEHHEPESSVVTSTHWPDFYGLVDRKLAMWNTHTRTGEHLLTITEFGKEELQKWVSRRRAVPPIVH